jgi:hypothetical protein
VKTFKLELFFSKKYLKLFSGKPLKLYLSDIEIFSPKKLKIQELFFGIKYRNFFRGKNQELIFRIKYRNLEAISEGCHANRSMFFLSIARIFSLSSDFMEVPMLVVWCASLPI